MAIAALIAWVVTALGGFYLLGTWLARGGTRQPRTSHFPPALIFGHFALAAIGLVVWICYVIIGVRWLAWTGFVLLIPVAALGFLMLRRWIPGYRARTAAPAGGPGTRAAPRTAPEAHFPVVVVGAHGVLAVVTVVLVLLAALGV